MLRELNIVQPPISCPGAVTVAEFKARLVEQGVFSEWRKYERVTFETDNLEGQSRLLQLAFILKFRCSGECLLIDSKGLQQVGSVWLVRRSFKFLYAATKFQLARFLEPLRLRLSRRRRVEMPIRQKRVLYLRTDPWRGEMFGGSVAHISGVVNGFQDLGWQVELFSSTPMPLLNDDVVQHEVVPNPGSNDVLEATPLCFSNEVAQRAMGTAAPPGFVYQRYGLHAAAGLHVAKQFSKPLVVEFNGSELWIGEQWGSPVKYQRLARRIEREALTRADLVVCVSEVDAASLRQLGVDEKRILVNPNGYDEKRFHPAVDGSAKRSALAGETEIVFMFAGTFGLWHGVPRLVRSFLELLASGVDAKLVCVGDGVTRKEAEQAAAGSAKVVFTGRIAPEEMPVMLAAADVLVAPHVPNPDGSEFFGSPVKIFEYMAMAKPIVAARLGQMSTILEHETSALLFSPDRDAELTAMLQRLALDKALRERLGERAQALSERYTWKMHTHRILEKLQALGIV